jgi:hypothetical protein
MIRDRNTRKYLNLPLDRVRIILPGSIFWGTTQHLCQDWPRLPTILNQNQMVAVSDQGDFKRTPLQVALHFLYDVHMCIHV